VLLSSSRPIRDRSLGLDGTQADDVHQPIEQFFRILGASVLVELSSLIESRSESLSVIHESRVSPSHRPRHLMLSEPTVPREDTCAVVLPSGGPTRSKHPRPEHYPKAIPPGRVS
jgi:hypothetical protein